MVEYSIIGQWGRPVPRRAKVTVEPNLGTEIQVTVNRYQNGIIGPGRFLAFSNLVPGEWEWGGGEVWEGEEVYGRGTGDAGSLPGLGVDRAHQCASHQSLPVSPSNK